MTPPIIPAWLRVASVLALLAAVFLAGCAIEGWRKDAEIANLKRATAQEKANAAVLALHRLQQSQARGDVLAARLNESQAAIDSLAQEKENAIRRLTARRPCLGGAAVRVLNQPVAAQPSAVPTAASEPVADDAAFATDTDVGIWIAGCRRDYDTCRGRLQAIADFFTDQPTESAD